MIRSRGRLFAALAVAAAACVAYPLAGPGAFPAIAAPQKGKAPLALGLTAAARRWTDTTKPSGPLGSAPVRNFGVVVPGCIYRSAQPTAKGFAWLKSQGFRSVVSLRKEKDFGAEYVGKFGLKYLYIPITDWTAPSMKQGEQFLQFARNPENWPLVVHCEAGQGRAGCMAALVRYSMGGWPMDRAMEEGRRYRTVNWPFFGGQSRFLRRWAQTHPRGGIRPSGALALDD